MSTPDKNNTTHQENFRNVHMLQDKMNRQSTNHCWQSVLYKSTFTCLCKS